MWPLQWVLFGLGLREGHQGARKILLAGSLGWLVPLPRATLPSRQHSPYSCPSRSSSPLLPSFSYKALN